MRKHIILAAIAAIASFTACSNEEEEEQIPGAEVNFTINNTVTRAITDATGLTTFGEGDKVYIYSKGLYAQEMEGVEFTVDGTSLIQNSEDTYRYNGTKGATFTAYHYNNTSISDGNITVGSDQSNEGDFQKYDLMTAQVTASNPTGTPINFEFKHRFSLVKVDVSAIESVGLTISSVTINNVKCMATWNSDDNSIAVSGDAMSVKMGKFESSPKVFWAIIPAQNISAQDLIEVVTSTNKVYTYTNAGSVTFEEGKMKKFTLSASGFKTVSATISASSSWTEDIGVNGTANERILELITAEQGTFSDTNFPESLTSFSDNQVTVGKWYMVNTKSTQAGYETECNWEDDKLSITTAKAEWFTIFAGFRLDEISINKSYSKRFNITVSAYSNVAETQLKVGLMGINNSSTYNKKPHFKFGNTNGYETITCTTESKDYTYTVDLNYIDNEKQGASVANWESATEEDYKDVVLYLAPMTASTYTDGAFSVAKSVYVTKVTMKEIVP